jgi:hypothetical protein
MMEAWDEPNQDMGSGIGSGIGSEPSPMIQPAETNPKCLLNQFVMRYTGKPVVKGDMQFHTVASPTGNGFTCSVRITKLDEAPEFHGDCSETEKLAEQSASQKALDHYADWIAANPAIPKPEGQKKKSKTKRKAGDVGEGVGPDKQMRFEDYNLKFVDGPEQHDAASKKSLNNQPAWMTKGLGVNKDFFGESKGNLVKPGMYEEDIAKIEEKKGNPLGDGPDPFGDVFAERKTGSEVSTSPPRSNPWRSVVPLGSQDAHFGRTPVVASTPIAPIGRGSVAGAIRPRAPGPSGIRPITAAGPSGIRPISGIRPTTGIRPTPSTRPSTPAGQTAQKEKDIDVWSLL